MALQFRAWNWRRAGNLFLQWNYLFLSFFLVDFPVRRMELDVREKNNKTHNTINIYILALYGSELESFWYSQAIICFFLVQHCMLWRWLDWIKSSMKSWSAFEWRHQKDFKCTCTYQSYSRSICMSNEHATEIFVLRFFSCCSPSNHSTFLSRNHYKVDSEGVKVATKPEYQTTTTKSKDD